MHEWLYDTPSHNHQRQCFFCQKEQEYVINGSNGGMDKIWIDKQEIPPLSDHSPTYTNTTTTQSQQNPSYSSQYQRNVITLYERGLVNAQTVLDAFPFNPNQTPTNAPQPINTTNPTLDTLNRNPASGNPPEPPTGFQLGPAGTPCPHCKGSGRKSEEPKEEFIIKPTINNPISGLQINE